MSGLSYLGLGIGMILGLGLFGVLSGKTAPKVGPGWSHET